MSLNESQESAHEEALKRLDSELFRWQEIEEDKDYSEE